LVFIKFIVVGIYIYSGRSNYLAGDWFLFCITIGSVHVFDS
jgi:hypothetical protein